jgi:hypothetical protein
MVLCHNCSGLLAYSNQDDTAGLRGCSCISGYVRGFEPDLTREQAIDAQIEEAAARIESYKRQGRSSQHIDPEMKTLEELKALKGEN